MNKEWFKRLRLNQETWHTKTFSLDSKNWQPAMLSHQKIDTTDLDFLEKFQLTDWNGRVLDAEMLVKSGYWIVNDEKTLVFYECGGGSCEIPEMYELIFKEQKIRVYCGGGGIDPREMKCLKDGNWEISIFVTEPVHNFV
jgi:hypothetical protein